jgi:hypothetical protein
VGVFVAEEHREGNLTEKYFSNLVVALGLGFLLGVAVTQKASRPAPPRPV